MCHLSCVMCHVSPVACHLSPIKKKITCKKKNYIYPLEKIGQRGGPSWWRVCYQRGLPRLVFKVPTQRLSQGAYILC